MTKLLFVVEDDRYIRGDLVELLEMEGYEVNSFANGKEAFEALTAADRAPSLVILDLMMPVMNGYEFVEALSNEPRFEKIPILIVSADRQAVSLIQAQVRGCLQKPIDLDQLLEAVARVFHEARLSSSI